MIVTTSSELQATQARTNTPFGLQFLQVPRIAGQGSVNMATKTRDCEETSRDGTTDMDCIDDEEK